MNSATLERLLIDRALGALPPDAQELLAAYLAFAPQHARDQSSIDAVVSAARTALAADPPRQLPPFPSALFQREQIIRRRWQFAARITQLAACILLGAGLAYTLVLRNAAPPRQAITSNAPPAGDQPPAPLPAVAHAGRTENPKHAGEFWSKRRLLADSSTAHSRPSAGLRWDSPSKMPSLGEQR